jgi:hypothetical protein
MSHIPLHGEFAEQLPTPCAALCSHSVTQSLHFASQGFLIEAMSVICD